MLNSGSTGFNSGGVRATISNLRLTPDLVSSTSLTLCALRFCSSQRLTSNVHPGVRLANMAQAGPITDVTQRLFAELKSKNEEARARAAYELYDYVLSVSRGMSQSQVLQPHDLH